MAVKKIKTAGDIFMYTPKPVAGGNPILPISDTSAKSVKTSGDAALLKHRAMGIAEEPKLQSNGSTLGTKVTGGGSITGGSV